MRLIRTFVPERSDADVTIAAGGLKRWSSRTLTWNFEKIPKKRFRKKTTNKSAFMYPFIEEDKDKGVKNTTNHHRIDIIVIIAPVTAALELLYFCTMLMYLSPALYNPANVRKNALIVSQ